MKTPNNDITHMHNAFHNVEKLWRWIHRRGGAQHVPRGAFLLGGTRYPCRVKSGVFLLVGGCLETAIRPGREGGRMILMRLKRGGGSVCVGGHLMWSLCVLRIWGINP